MNIWCSAYKDILEIIRTKYMQKSIAYKIGFKEKKKRQTVQMVKNSLRISLWQNHLKIDIVVLFKTNTGNFAFTVGMDNYFFG